MPAKSVDFSNRVLDGTYGGPQLDLPANIRIALYTITPGDSGGGTEVDTADWTNYAPVVIANNSTNFPAASGQMKSNGVEISFGTPVIVNPVSLTGFATFDDDTDEYLHFWSFDAPIDVDDGVPLRWDVGALVFVEE